VVAYSGLPYFFTRSGGMLFFVADDGLTGSELWKTDGTAGSPAASAV